MNILKITKITSGIFLLALGIFACVPMRAVIATKISDFADGTEPPKNIYHPNTGVFTPNNGFISQTDSTTGELAGITRLTLRFRNTGVDASNPWWDNDRTTTSTDRQRSEVKGITSKSYDQKPGETYEYSVTWRSSPGILITNQFFHFFQIKGVDGDNGSPLVVMSITSSTVAQVRYTSPGVSGFINVISGKNIPFTPNTWQTITIRVTPCSKSDGSTSDGSIYVSVNGEPFWGSSGLKLYCASTTSYHSKFGMYRGISGGTAKLNDGYIQHLYPSQNKYVAGATPTPAITSISPTSAAVGDTITLTGSNLKATTAIVTIGGGSATNVSVSADGTTATATVPATAASGYVVLRNDNGTAVAPQQFTQTTVTPAPTVTDVSPASAAVGDTITLTGANLANATVTLDSAMAVISSNDGATLKFKVPAGVLDGKILVTTPGGAISPTQILDVGQAPAAPGILYEAEDLPVTVIGTGAANLKTDSPAHGGFHVQLENNAVGSAMEFTLPADFPAGTYHFIFGAKTHTTRGIVQVSIDGTDIGAPWDQYSPIANVYTSIDLGVVTLAAGAHTIRLTVVGTTTSSPSISADYFQFVPVGSDTTPPLLMLPYDYYMVFPATSPDGAIVTFAPTAMDDTDGDVPVTCAPASGSLFPIGVTAVTVTATDLSGNTSTDTFNVTVYSPDTSLPAPTVTNVSPTTASPGDTITITGANLTDATVTIGGQSATVLSTSSDGATLTVKVPDNTTSGAIVVSTAAGSAPTQTITINTTTPADPVLTVDKIMLSLAQGNGATAAFNLTSNITWTTTVSPTTATWLTCVPNAGAGNASPAATAASANTTGAPRTASIVVSGGSITRTLIATQAATNILDTSFPTGATLTLTTNTAPSTINTYTVAAGNKLIPAGSTTTLGYEYASTGAAATLIIDNIDGVYSMLFTSTNAGTLTFYGIDANGGPSDLAGAFSYTMPAALTYALTLNKATANPAAATYAAGTTITLTAAAAPSGQVFDKWTATPASITFANANATTTTFTMPAAATTVTANYKTQSAGGNTSGGSSSGGGGGGGAPSLWFLAALAALICTRLRKLAS